MNIETYLSASRDQHLAELFELLRIPSISADPSSANDVRRCASWVCERLADAGLGTRIYETEGHPIVYGEWLGAPGAPTVLIYGHYDVQPPDPLELWRNPPFEPTLEGGNIIARGATDDKGQFYCHIKGIEAHMRVHGRLPVNVKVVIEGEEEVSSEHLAPFLEAHREMLKADVAVISDTPMHGPGKPSITFALRGLTYFEIAVRGPSHDLHSGLYGGGVANPVNKLAQIIASFHDADGRVAVEGFYDDVRPLSAAERQEMVELGHDEAAFRKELDVEATPGEAGYSVLERVTARPTLDCNGIWGGYTGEGAKTVLPSLAKAKFSCRLVANQRPDDIRAKVEAHVAKVTPPGVKVELTYFHGGEPAMVDRDIPAMQAAFRAQERVWGVRPVFTRGGGSIPIVADFRSILGLDAILLGFGLEDDRLHSPNEKFAVENYYNGIRSSAALLEELAR